MRRRGFHPLPSAAAGSDGDGGSHHAARYDRHESTVSVRERPRSLEQLDNSYMFFVSTLQLRIGDLLPKALHCFGVPEEKPQWRAMLSRLHADHVRPYDGTKAEDVDLLKRLWAAHARLTFRAEAQFSLVDNTWKQMGFQSTDPTRDFRGGGRLSLEQLVYLAERHPHDWNRMLGGDYLLGATGINVTLWLIALLEIGSTPVLGPLATQQAARQFTRAQARCQICSFVFDESVTATFEKVNEVYCAVMRLVFRRWEDSPKNLLMFNALLTRVYAETETLLYFCESLEEFTQLLS